MIAVGLKNVSAVKGEVVSVRVSHEQVFAYRLIEIEIFDAGVQNPSHKLSFSVQPIGLDDHGAHIEIDSSLLSLGIFEVRRIRLLEPLDESVNEVVGFAAGKDFERRIFEVVDSVAFRRSEDAVRQSVLKAEADLDERFFTAVDIRQSASCVANEYFVFVFVRDLLVGVPIRLNGMELVPTNSGLESLDAFNFVNGFFEKSNFSSAKFFYDEASSNASRSSNPVCVVYFPALISSSSEEARDYCVGRTNELILAYALLRDAGGVPFDVVVFDHTNRRADKFAVISPYVGNLLTGIFAGESAAAVEVYLGGLLRDPLNELLVGLYREARRERNPDFQYLRYWQILETMADAKNYDSSDQLVDYEGRVILDAQNNPRRCDGSVNVVFSLIRDSGIGVSTEAWKNVNVWFAFRNAVAHHGAVSRYTALSKKSVRDWAEVGLMEISANAGRDVLLEELRECSRLLLMRRLSGSLS